MPFSHVLAIELCTNTSCEKKSQGFVSAVSIMRDFVPAIYDTTVIVPKDSPQPTMLRILKGQSSVVSFLTT
jgi:lysophosphatidic acid acyltransferase/lysophosphatidylinositol acyltransferase